MGYNIYKVDRDMSIFLYVIPLLALISGAYIYRHNGKFEIFNLDLVQFFYTFLLAPLLFIWGKSFMYVLLQAELGNRISQTQLFLIDSGFTVVMLYVYAFLVMHSLTKTFRLRSERDPLYDLFHHSEYIHLWLSHIVVVIGVLTFFCIIGAVNIFFPLNWQFADIVFYSLCVGGFLAGCITFLAIALTDPKQEGRRYMRLMKVVIGLFFLLMISAAFVWTPEFSGVHGMFWFMFTLFTTLFIWALITYSSSKINSWFAGVTHANKDTDFWGINTQLFSKKKK